MGGKEGMCKFEATLKTMQQHNKSVFAESVNSQTNHARRISDGAGRNPVNRFAGDEEWRRAREKDETLFHLIYWGPN